MHASYPGPIQTCFHEIVGLLSIILTGHSLSQDPNSTLGRGTTLNKTNLSCSIVESKVAKENPYTVEMNPNFSTVNEASVTDPESESKVDLEALQASDGSTARKQVMPLKSVEDIKFKEPQNIIRGNEENDDKI